MKIRQLMRNLSRKIANFSTRDITKVFTCITLASTICCTPTYAQIITDGNTKTSVRSLGDTTTIRTTTTKGDNAFNSFSQFNVAAGKTVNIELPVSTNTIINLVHGSQSKIYGKLQSIQNGKIGGHMIWANPYGFIIDGTINAGSLTMVTPTVDFMDSFFTRPFTPDSDKVNAVLNNTTPINPQGNIWMDGTINVKDNVIIDTYKYVANGDVYTDANFGLHPALGEIVNLNSVEFIEENDPANIVLEKGSIKIISERGPIIKGNMFSGKSVEIASNENNWIELYGNIYCKSNPRHILNVGTLGYITPGSNIEAAVNKGVINVSDIHIDTNNGGLIELKSIDGGDIKVFGDAKIILAGNAADVDIVNYSNKDLQLNTIKFDGNITPGQIKINKQKITENYENLEIISKPGSINVENKSASNIIIANILESPDGVININNNKGNILTQEDSSSLSAKNINLKAEYGAIGSKNSPVLTKLQTGTLNAFAQNDININQQEGSLNVGEIVSTNGDAIIKALDGSILGSNSTVKTNITAKNISLYASDEIGSYYKHLKIDEDNVSGSINATANNNIFLNENSGDMRVDQIKSLNNGDIFLSVRDGSVIDATNSDKENIIGGNLVIANPQSYYFIGINGHYDDWGFYNSFTNGLKQVGENWAKTPDSNIRLFEYPDVNVQNILDTLEIYSKQLNKNDVFMVSYEGHGWGGGNPGTPYDENLHWGVDTPPFDENNGIALNAMDEYFTITAANKIGVQFLSDDQLGSALQHSKGTVFVATDSCLGGGMFGGDSDVDQVAIRNGFNLYGLSNNIEGRNSRGSAYTMPDGNNYSFVGQIYQTMFTTLTKENPTFDTFDATGNKITVQLDNPYSSDGNVYLNQLYDAIHKGTYYDGVYPIDFTEYTNMSHNDFNKAPIISQQWDPYTQAIGVQGIGQEGNSLTVNLTGNLNAMSNGIVNVTGNIAGTTSIQATENIALTQTAGNLNADSIVSENGSINIEVLTGQANINNISAAGTINIVQNSLQAIHNELPINTMDIQQDNNIINNEKSMSKLVNTGNIIEDSDNTNTLKLVDEAINIYNNAINKGYSVKKAEKKALKKLIDAGINVKKAKVLLSNSK